MATTQPTMTRLRRGCSRTATSPVWATSRNARMPTGFLRGVPAARERGVEQHGAGVLRAEIDPAGYRAAVPRARRADARVEGEGTLRQVGGGAQPEPADEALEFRGLGLPARRRAGAGHGGRPEGQAEHTGEQERGAPSVHRRAPYRPACGSPPDFCGSVTVWRWLISGASLVWRTPAGHWISTR